MDASNSGLALIAGFEACCLLAFMDGSNPAIGFSHHGKDIVAGKTIWTVEQSVQKMIDDCHVCAVVLERAITATLTQKQWNAIISLAYNVGPGTIRDSRFVRDLNALTGLETVAGTGSFFFDYEHPGRRARENDLFVN